MPFDANGIFNRVFTYVTGFSAGDVIMRDDHDQHDQDIADAITANRVLIKSVGASTSALTLARAGVIDKDIGAPPALIQTGLAYIVGPGATGDWLGREDQIAVFNGAAWDFYSPVTGETVFVRDEGIYYTYSAADGWQPPASPAVRRIFNTIEDAADAGLVADDLALILDPFFVGKVGATSSLNPLAGQIAPVGPEPSPHAWGLDSTATLDYETRVVSGTPCDVALNDALQFGVANNKQIGRIGAGGYRLSGDLTLKEDGQWLRGSGYGAYAWINNGRPGVFTALYFDAGYKFSTEPTPTPEFGDDAFVARVEDALFYSAGGIYDDVFFDANRVIQGGKIDRLTVCLDNREVVGAGTETAIAFQTMAAFKGAVLSTNIVGRRDKSDRFKDTSLAPNEVWRDIGWHIGADGGGSQTDINNNTTQGFDIGTKVGLRLDEIESVTFTVKESDTATTSPTLPSYAVNDNVYVDDGTGTIIQMVVRRVVSDVIYRADFIVTSALTEDGEYQLTSDSGVPVTDVVFRIAIPERLYNNLQLDLHQSREARIGMQILAGSNNTILFDPTFEKVLDSALYIAHDAGPVVIHDGIFSCRARAHLFTSGTNKGYFLYGAIQIGDPSPSVNKYGRVTMNGPRFTINNQAAVWVFGAGDDGDIVEINDMQLSANGGAGVIIDNSNGIAHVLIKDATEYFGSNDFPWQSRLVCTAVRPGDNQQHVLTPALHLARIELKDKELRVPVTGALDLTGRKMIPSSIEATGNLDITLDATPIPGNPMRVHIPSASRTVKFFPTGNSDYYDPAQPTEIWDGGTNIEETSTPNYSEHTGPMTVVLHVEAPGKFRVEEIT